MKRTALCVLLLLSYVLMFSCGKESKSPTGPPLEDTYTISGTVTSADSVLVTLSGGASDSVKVSAGETYTFMVPEGGNYTVTPSKEGYAFTPSVGVFTNVRANITQNFAAVLNKVAISGVVTGADSVTVTLSGDASEAQTVNDGGTYTFTVQQGKNFTVTPSRAGYGFTPESKTFSGVTVNQKQDFTALQDTYTISGTVTGADNVTVTLSGDATASWTVKKSGESYSFTVATGGTYTVTPSKSGYAFSPSNKAIKNLAANQTQNFDAKPITYTISGTVTGADSVTITLSGSSSATWTVNSGGTYSFDVATFGTYTVTPSKSGFVFTPPNKTVENLVANYVQSFDAKPLFTLSGTITSADGVTVTLSGDASDRVSVDSGGAYSFTVPRGGTYTVTPSKQWYSFTPASKAYEYLSGNQTQNFDAKRDTYTLSGTIAGVDGVTVTLSGDAVGTQTVNNGGIYSFTVNAGGSYTVTPSKSGYTFVPAEVANVVVGDKDVVVQTFVGTTSGGGDGTGTGNGGSNTYLPYKVGATWTYDSVYDPEGLNSKSTMVDKVVGTRVINGKTCWMVESRDMDATYGWADTSFVRIDGNTAYGFISFGLFAKPALKAARAAKIAKAARALLDSYGDEMPLLKFGLSSGQTWTIYNSGVYLGTSVVITGKSLGTESVTVTAGSFSSCAKIEITVDMTMKDSTGTWTLKTVTTSWFAPNVGEVKSSDVITSNDGKDTFTYKTEDTLKSYIIP